VIVSIWSLVSDLSPKYALQLAAGGHGGIVFDWTWSAISPACAVASEYESRVNGAIPPVLWHIVHLSSKMGFTFA
jgi:hypothetical protein